MSVSKAIERIEQWIDRVLGQRNRLDIGTLRVPTYLMLSAQDAQEILHHLPADHALRSKVKSIAAVAEHDRLGAGTVVIKVGGDLDSSGQPRLNSRAWPPTSSTRSRSTFFSAPSGGTCAW